MTSLTVKYLLKSGGPSNGDFLLLFAGIPLAILDFLMMGVGFMFLGVYPLSVPFAQRSQ